MKKILGILAVFISTVAQADDTANVFTQEALKNPEIRKIYEQTTGSPNGSQNPKNKAAAEFASKFASQALVFPYWVEKTKEGTTVLVAVGRQRCKINVIEREGKMSASFVECGE